MQPQAKTMIDLENKFWQSMVDNDADTAMECSRNNRSW